MKHRGEIEASIPLAPLADQAPLYHRPMVAPTPPPPLGEVADHVVTLAEADAAREALGVRVDALVQRILWEFGDEGD